MSNHDSEQDLVDQLADEFLDRRDRGENCTIEEYVERHPERADDIRDVFAALNFVRTSRPRVNPLPSIPDYEIVKEIGRGGMGIVYEARQISLDRKVALKVVPQSLIDNELSLKRFELEARTAARLEHDNIVPVYDFGFDEKLNYFSMRLIDGYGLDRVIRDVHEIVNQSDSSTHNRGQILNGIQSWDTSSVTDASLPDTQADSSTTRPDTSSRKKHRSYYHKAAQICLQAAEALAYAHDLGIVHRDIKPSNLLLDRSGKVWVADFGLAKTESQDLTSTGNVVGTLRFLSPERLDGVNDKCSDVYSLGMTLYELLSLEPAFQGPNQLNILEKIRDKNPSSLKSIDSGIPNDLQIVVEKSIEKDPRRRYASAHEMADDLRLFLDDRPIKARRVSKLEQLYSWAKRNPLIAGSLTTIFVLLVVSLIGSIAVAIAFGRMASEQSRLAKLADEQAKLKSQNLYFAEMRLAHQAIESDGGLASVISYLGNWSPQNQEIDLRGFEWYWLTSRSNDVKRVLHDVSPNFIRFSPDASRICFGHQYMPPVLSHFPSMNFHRELDCGDVVYSEFKFDRTGNKIAILFHSKKQFEWQRLAVFDVETGRELFKTGDEFVLGFDFCPTRDQLVVLVSNDDSTNDDHQGSNFQVYDTNEFEIQHHSTYSLTQVRQLYRANVNFHPNGERLSISRLSTENGRTLVDIYETEKWKFELLSPWTADEIYVVDWHREKDVMAIATSEGRIIIWDLVTNQFQQQKEERFTESLQWYPGSDDLVVASQNYVKVIESMSLEQKKKFSVPFDYTKAVFSPDRSALIVGTCQDGLVEIDTTSIAERTIGTQAREIDGELFWSDDETLICFQNGSLNSVWLADSGERANAGVTPMPGDFLGWNEKDQLASRFRDVVSIWDKKGLNKLQDFHLQENSPNRIIATLPSNRFLIESSPQSEIAIWGLEIGKIESTIPVENFDFYHAFSFHNDSSRLAAWNDEKIWIIDIESNARLKIPSERILSLAWNKDGTKLAAAGRSNEIRIYDTRSLAQLESLDGATGRVVTLDFSPDGRRLAAGSRDNTIRIWDTQTGQIAMVIHRETSVCDVAWSPSGMQFAALTINGELKIWDARRGYQAH